MNLVFLNEAWLDINEAKISVLDRGFIFGDGVYEVIPVYRRRPFRAAQHLNRLQYSLDGIRLANPYTQEVWQNLIQQLIAHHQEVENQSLYIQITRGVAPRGHAFPEKTIPTVFMMSSPLKRPTEEQVRQGVSGITVEDRRWLHCDYKTTALLGNVLACQQAMDQGVMEVVQFRNGLLTEGSSSNIMIVRNGTIYAPQKNHLILHGITMDAVSEAAARAGHVVHHQDISEADVRSADEIWVSSSTKEVLAMTQLDGQPVGEGQPGAVFKQVYASLQQELSAL
jgi:D-alanine transaminase